MAKQSKKTTLLIAAVLVLVAIAAAIIYRISFYKPAPAEQREQPSVTPEHRHGPENPAGADKAAVSGDSPSGPRKPTLRQIVARARYWGPAYSGLYGSQAPNFTVTDLDGKRHRLSDYRGRTVMLIFWAAWCRPCIVEIPHLIELRRTIGEDRLVMLAITYAGPMNSEKTIRSFVSAHNDINYPVIAANLADMPAPYNSIRGIPASFFIRPDGKIKLATEGLLNLADSKAIIEAQQ